MSPLALGVLIGVVTIAVLATGIPIAFGLGLVALGFLIAVDGWGSLSIVADTFFAGLAEFGLVAIPMFVLMGAAVASSPAGKDLYRSEEHTSELQSLMRNSYAVFCLKKKKHTHTSTATLPTLNLQ